MFHRFMLTYVLNDVRMRSISAVGNSTKDKKAKYQAVVAKYRDNLAMEYGMYNGAATMVNIRTNLSRFMNLIIGSIPMEGHDGLGKPVEAARAYVVSALFSQITTRVTQIGVGKHPDQPQIMITYLSRYLMIMMSALIQASNAKIEAILKNPRETAGDFKNVLKTAHAAAISKFQGNGDDTTTSAAATSAATTSADYISKYKHVIGRLSSTLKKVVAENERLGAENTRLRIGYTELSEQLNVARQESQVSCENCRILERDLGESENKLKTLRGLAREQKSKIDSFEKHVERAVSSSDSQYVGQAVMFDDSATPHLGQPLMFGDNDDNAYSGSPITFGDDTSDDAGTDAVLSVGSEEPAIVEENSLIKKKTPDVKKETIIGGFIGNGGGDPLAYGDDVVDALTIAGTLQQGDDNWF